MTASKSFFFGLFLSAAIPEFTDLVAVQEV